MRPFFHDFLCYLKSTLLCIKDLKKPNFHSYISSLCSHKSAVHFFIPSAESFRKPIEKPILIFRPFCPAASIIALKGHKAISL